MRRVVLDTNVFIGSAYNPRSASRRIVDACCVGTLRLVVSPEVRREYDRILPRAIRIPEPLEAARAVIDAADEVVLDRIPRICEDPEDDKFLATAVAGSADAVVSSDAHLLQVVEHQGIPILTPSAFLDRWKGSGEALA